MCRICLISIILQKQKKKPHIIIFVFSFKDHSKHFEMNVPESDSQIPWIQRMEKDKQPLIALTGGILLKAWNAKALLDWKHVRTCFFGMLASGLGSEICIPNLWSCILLANSLLIIFMWWVSKPTSSVPSNYNTHDTLWSVHSVA